MKKIKYFDTFAGIGGFHLALEKSIGKENIKCIGFSEIDKFAKQVYLEHFPNSKDFGDITKIDIDELPDFDLLTGGFPCQSFSVAGKQLGFEDARGQMIYYLLEILEKKQPGFFVFENVKAFMGKKFVKEREIIFKKMYDIGYKIDVKILNTKDFGLPQNRERVFIVGRRSTNTDFNFPEGQELSTFLKDILEEEVDEKFYMTLKQYDKLNYESLKRIYEKVAPALDTMQGGHRQPKVLFNKYNNRVMKDISGTIGCHNGFTNKTGYSVCIGYNTRSRDFRNSGFREISPTLCARDYKDPKQVIIIERGHGYFKGTVGPKKILNTVRANIQGNTLLEEKPFRIRKITPTECARLQGFPDNWSTDFVSNSQAYKQAGNAISIPVVKSIFDNLLK